MIFLALDNCFGAGHCAIDPNTQQVEDVNAKQAKPKSRQSFLVRTVQLGVILVEVLSHGKEV